MLLLTELRTKPGQHRKRRWIANVGLAGCLLCAILYFSVLTTKGFRSRRVMLGNIFQMYFNRRILHASCIKWSKRCPEVTILVPYLEY